MLQLCKVTESLFISNARSACSDELLQKEAVSLCINVSMQQPCPPVRLSATLRVPVYDDPSEDLHAHFDRCADVILREAARGGRTVVYCKNGRSRSATICIAYLMKHQSLSLTEAHEVNFWGKFLRLLPTKCLEYVLWSGVLVVERIGSFNYSTKSADSYEDDSSPVDVFETTQSRFVVKSARSVVEPNAGFWAQLERYEQELKSRSSASCNLTVSPS